MIENLTREEFEKEALAALETLPEVFKEKMKNVDIVIEENIPKNRQSVLGLYEGIPLNNRGIFYGNVLPDKITLFKKNIERISSSMESLRKNVRDVIVHEIAHHFGLSEKEIRDSGY